MEQARLQGLLAAELAQRAQQSQQAPQEEQAQQAAGTDDALDAFMTGLSEQMETDKARALQLHWSHPVSWTSASACMCFMGLCTRTRRPLDRAKHALVACAGSRRRCTK